jgi:hypothetical protein
MSKEHFGRVCRRAQQRKSFFYNIQGGLPLGHFPQEQRGDGSNNQKKVNLLRNKTRGKTQKKKDRREYQRVITLSGFLII